MQPQFASQGQMLQANPQPLMQQVAPQVQQMPQAMQQVPAPQQPAMQEASMQPAFGQVPEPVPMPNPEPTMATVSYPQAGASNAAQSTAGAALQPVIEPIEPLQLGSLGEPVLTGSYDAAQSMAYDELPFESAGSGSLYSESGYQTEQTYVETEIIESTPEPLPIPEPSRPVISSTSSLVPDTSGLDKSPFFAPQTPEKSKEDVFLLPIDAKGNTEPLAFAVIGFLSTLFMFPPLGLALCIIALSMGADEKRHNLYNSHRGLTTLFAVLGMVLNIAVLVVEILMVAVLGMTPAVILGYFL